jgi:hypothetical protein
MDFASLMKAELEAKKAKMQAVKSQAGKSWMKQSELKQAELEAKKRASTPTAQDGPAAKKAKQDESPALKPVDGKDGSKTDGTAITKTEVKISDATNVWHDLELLIYWPFFRSVYCLPVPNVVKAPVYILTIDGVLLTAVGYYATIAGEERTNKVIWRKRC